MQHAGFVVDLHHDDAMIGIDLRQMFHESGKGAPIGIQQFGRENRQHRLGHGAGIGEGLCELSLRNSTGKTGWIGAHPSGRIGRAGILERSKPDQHQPQIVLSGLRNLGIDQSIIVTAFLRFEVFPTHRADHRADVHCFQFVPYRLHIVGVGGTGIV
jgi:hypothetical protein